jgi:hypothetical protein
MGAFNLPDVPCFKATFTARGITLPRIADRRNVMGSEREGDTPEVREESDQPLEDTEEDVFQPDPRLYTTFEARPKRLAAPERQKP